MIANLIAAMLALFATLTPAPAPAVTPPAQPVSTAGSNAVESRGSAVESGGEPRGLSPANNADAPVRPGPMTPAPIVDEPPACHGIEEWDGEHCVAMQLPEETIGRAYG